ncbi:MAG: FKBP-type peptidyl-prolyl cis-trans isomerase [Bdellovibrionota bacterium]
MNFSLKNKIKNRTINTLVLVLFMVGVSSCTKKLDTDGKKASYAIGQQIGKNLKQQFPDFDADALAAAIKDAQKDKNQMTDKDMQDAMMKMQMAAMEKQKVDAEKNSKAAQEFLEKNKTVEGVKVTPSGLQYIIEKPGTGKSPKADDAVKCDYKGTLVDGTVFDSSYERGEPVDFPLKGVIPGWTEGLQLLKAGGKMKLFVPPELGYGNQGRPKIPPGSVLIFEIELIEILKK